MHRDPMRRGKASRFPVIGVRTVSRIAGGIAVAAALSVGAIVVWSALNRPEPAPRVPLASGPALGDLVGYVGRVDLQARTVEVAEDLLGQRPVTMAVTNDTSISVGGKQGGLGDLTRDLPVRAVYEVRNDVKYVTSIVADAARAPGPPAARTPVETRPPTETSAAAASAARPIPRSAPVDPAARPAPPLAPVESAARPAEPDAADGSAAVDWLLKELRR